PRKVRVVFFGQTTEKSPPFSPCIPKFWRCCTFAKPTYLKRGIQEIGLLEPLYRQNRQSFRS
ncbi:hypothetical protein, partial [Pedobacter suwonensis]|uniref:hypothetical protein n=1 Tax=Pedobacter suwonensis TaxID=332999 RepID=UPI003D012E56